MWPGFGENSRVLKWIFERTSGNDNAMRSAVGYIPSPNAIDLGGLSEQVDMTGLFSLPREFWTKEISEIRKYFDEQVNKDLPDEITRQLNGLEERVKSM